MLTKKRPDQPAKDHYGQDNWGRNGLSRITLFNREVFYCFARLLPIPITASKGATLKGERQNGPYPVETGCRHLKE
jgi:hypothetical protein